MQKKSCDTDANAPVLFRLHPHFTRQLSFVTSRSQSATRVGSRQTVATIIRWKNKQELAAV